MNKQAILSWARAALVTLAAATTAILSPVLPMHAQEPIKIGFSVSLTGGLASSGKAHLLSKQIWEKEINAKGGLARTSGQARLL